MDREDLLEQYEAGRLDDAHRLQQVRDGIREHTDLLVPRRLSDVREWWSRNKSVVARRLKNDGEEDSGAEEEQTDEQTETSSTETASSTKEGKGSTDEDREEE